MAAHVYSRRFTGPYASTSTGYVGLMLVPAGRIYVLRFLTLLNTTASSATIRIVMGGGTTPVLSLIIPAGESRQEFLAIPLVTGDRIGTQCMTSPAGYTVTISGYDFSAI